MTPHEWTIAMPSELVLIGIGLLAALVCAAGWVAVTRLLAFIRGVMKDFRDWRM